MKYSINVDEGVYHALISSIGKENLEKKLEELLLATIKNLAQNYAIQILKFEEKYGVSFIEFEKLWDDGQIEKKYSYEVESDFIDWEMLEGEKGELLKLIANLKIHKRG